MFPPRFTSFSSLSAFLSYSTIREEGERFKCTYLTEIELSFSRGNAAKTRTVPVFTRFPLLKRRKSRSRVAANPFNSRVVKCRHREYISNPGNHPNVVRITPHRELRSSIYGEVKRENNRHADVKNVRSIKLLFGCARTRNGLNTQEIRN